MTNPGPPDDRPSLPRRRAADDDCPWERLELRVLSDALACGLHFQEACVSEPCGPYLRAVVYVDTGDAYEPVTPELLEQWGEDADAVRAHALAGIDPTDHPAEPLVEGRLLRFDRPFALAPRLLARPTLLQAAAGHDDVVAWLPDDATVLVAHDDDLAGLRAGFAEARRLQDAVAEAGTSAGATLHTGPLAVREGALVPWVPHLAHPLHVPALEAWNATTRQQVAAFHDHLRTHQDRWLDQFRGGLGALLVDDTGASTARVAWAEEPGAGWLVPRAHWVVFTRPGLGDAPALPWEPVTEALGTTFHALDDTLPTHWRLTRWPSDDLVDALVARTQR